MNDEIIEETTQIDNYSEFFDEVIPTLFLFVGSNSDNPSSNKEPWYIIKDDKKLFMPQKQVTGILESLEVRTITYDAQEAKKYKKEYSKKLRISLLKTDSKGVIKKITIQSGLTTCFSKSVLFKLSVLSESKKLGLPITIGAYVSDDDDKVVFAYLRSEGQSVKSEWDASADEVYFEHLATALNEQIMPF